MTEDLVYIRGIEAHLKEQIVVYVSKRIETPLILSKKVGRQESQHMRDVVGSYVSDGIVLEKK